MHIICGHDSFINVCFAGSTVYFLYNFNLEKLQNCYLVLKFYIVDYTMLSDLLLLLLYLIFSMDDQFEALHSNADV